MADRLKPSLEVVRNCISFFLYRLEETVAYTSQVKGSSKDAKDRKSDLELLTFE